MSAALDKIRRLLEASDRQLRAQAGEMIIALADPDVDAWVRSGIQFLPPQERGIARAAPVMYHRRLTTEVLVEVLDRSPDIDPPPGLHIVNDYYDNSVLDVSIFAAFTGLTDLTLQPDAYVSGEHHHPIYRFSSRRPLAGIADLARLPSLTELTIIGADAIDVAAIATALPHLRRLSLDMCTALDPAPDLSRSSLHRLDLSDVPGLTSLTVPETLRELRLDKLPDCVAVHGTADATELVDLSYVDMPGLVRLPATPPALRHLRVNRCPLASIAPLAGHPLNTIDLDGCADLASLDGFPTVLRGHRVSLAGCTGLTDIAVLGPAGAASVRMLDLRGNHGVKDLTALAQWTDLRVVALHGTTTHPDTVPPELRSSCTWAHNPDLDLLGRRASDRFASGRPAS